MTTSSISRLLRGLYSGGGAENVVADLYMGDDGLLYIIPRENMRPEAKDELERLCADNPTRYRYVRRPPHLRERTWISSLGFLRVAGWVAMVAVGIALATSHTRA